MNCLQPVCALHDPSTDTRTALKTSRRYKLLCPIARGLDRVGDKWTLLILRDLHAGPARFSDLQASLPGVAPNLLTERLRELESTGLVRRGSPGYNVSIYELTELGASTGPLLFALAGFGSQFPPEDEVTRPGNLRTVAVTLKMALKSVIDGSDSLRIELLIDDEQFAVSVSDGETQVLYGPCENPEAIVATSYVPLIEAADGRMPMSEFASEHIRLVEGSPEQAKRLLELLEAGMSGQERGD